MKHLEEITIDELHEALENVEGKQPTQRLLAAIAYKNGVAQTELAVWFNTGRRTIYSWLMRLDTDEPISEVVTNTHRSGRNRKLSGDNLDEFRQTVYKSPDQAGYDELAWTPELVQHHLTETYDVEYSIPSCRRLLKEAGLRYQKPRSSNAQPGAEDGDRFEEDLTKSKRRWIPQ